ncbi:hypothetical protein CASFOL_027999 [Castilleja foliolosa]|uniref:N-acetylglucosaminylphosphatidylinositol deacetylase n=1 Tax=Castilleja foliolosa TaxID=1961234 RepID=A0ABD3CH80_9LAMI
MVWVALIVSLAVLWFASLCKILHRSSSSAMKAAFGGASQSRNVLLVIAHPDDESMFFTPVINYLIKSGYNLHILCLSTGNADGMGSIRKEELHLACAVLKIPSQQVNVLDHPDLQDGFGKAWDWSLLASIIDDEIRTCSIDLIITFDDYGISGHCNHRDVHRGVRKLLLHDDVETWELISTSVIRKYIGPVDIWLSILFTSCQRYGQSHCLVNIDPRKSYAAMSQHSSQWVWFRKLFVAFSSYTYVNTLKKIK